VQGSDAPFNLGFALGAALALSPDTYVAMNGRLFRWDNVMKDREEGQFRAAQS
jgi:L-asparaginase